MNSLLLSPTDVFFFRDGRPMSGSLSGHGAAWPLPTVTNSALHAALHRAAVDGIIKDNEGIPVKVHGHDHHSRKGGKITDARKFGSLVTAGPFPVHQEKEKNSTWYFPRPLDANIKDSTAVSFEPLKKDFDRNHSSLPEPLRFPVANTQTATKEKPAKWWDTTAWQAYLAGKDQTLKDHFKTDASFSDTEHTYGIGIDPSTNTQNGEQFYSASYLRLKPGWKLGLLAEALDKIDNNSGNKRDLIQDLFPNSNTRTSIIAGGQQRVCSVERPCNEPIQLPIGLTKHFLDPKSGKHLVKWMLLTPAIFPAIEADPTKGITAHPGGWLPNWIYLDWNADENKAQENAKNGQVLLKAGDTVRREREGRESWRARVRAVPNIPATLVAALIDKPIPVTGYALPNKDVSEIQEGAKPTHLAVPAGSIYYFECTSPEDAVALAAALNWHGSETNRTTIRNRRSTLFGEKGFGLGVCGTWKFHEGKLTTESNIAGHP